MMYKSIITILLLCSLVLPAVTITPDENTYNCNFGTCDNIAIKIQRSGVPLSEKIYLKLTTTGNGYLEQVDGFIKRGKREFDLSSPFELEANDEYKLKYIGLGIGQMHLDVVGFDTETVYASLNSPYWNNSFGYRRGFNLTSSSTQGFFNYKVVINSTNINYSRTNDDGSDIKLTWYNASSGADQQINYYIPDTHGWNESGNSYIWIEAPVIDSSGEQYYYYYGNTTTVTDESNGFLTFPDFFDDGNDASLNSTLWNVTHNGGLTISESGGNIVLTADGSNDGAIKFNFAYDFGANKIITFYSEYEAGQGWYYGYNTLNFNYESGYYSNDMQISMSGVDAVTKQRTRAGGDGGSTSGTFSITDSFELRDFVRENNTANRYLINDISKDARTESTPDVNLGFVCYNTPTYSDNGDTYKIDYIFVRDYSSDTFTIAFGGEEEPAVSTVLNVTLESPSNNSINTSVSVTFGFTPNLSGDTGIGFSNCSIWTNSSGWALNKSNTSAITNMSVNTIAVTFPQSNLSYIWNVQCFANEGTSAFASANFSLNISYTAPPLQTTTTANSTISQRPKTKRATEFLGTELDTETKLSDLTLKQAGLFFLIGIGLLIMLGIIRSGIK